VFLLNDYIKIGQNKKNSRLYIGPMVILLVKGPLVKLMDVYTGRLLKSLINVSKLRRLSDSGRDILYNRNKPMLSESDEAENSNLITAVKTVDTPLDLSITGARHPESPNDQGTTTVTECTSNKRKPKLWSNEPIETGVQAPRIVRITAKKIQAPFAHYKCFFAGSDTGQWVSADTIPLQLIIDFNVQKFEKLQRKLQRQRLRYEC